MNFTKYIRVWLKTSALAIQGELVYPIPSIMFVSAKLIRFATFVVVLMVILGDTKRIGSYNLEQMIVFFLVFNFLDLIGQFFFRGIYWFRRQVVTGKLDLILVKPINPLFQILTSHTDILDLPLLAVVFYFLIKESMGVPFVNIIIFLALLFCSFLVITAVHIAVASIGVLTTEVDHSIWIYRDLSKLARVPVDIYVNWLRAVLTFVLPVAVVFTLPAKALLGILSWQWVLYSMLCSIFLVLCSILLWRYSLTQYSSASS